MYTVRGKNKSLVSFAHAQAAALAVAKYRKDPQGHLTMFEKIRNEPAKPRASKVKKPKDKTIEKNKTKAKTIEKKKKPKKWPHSSSGCGPDGPASSDGSIDAVLWKVSGEGD